MISLRVSPPAPSCLMLGTIRWRHEWWCDLPPPPRDTWHVWRGHVTSWLRPRPTTDHYPPPPPPCLLIQIGQFSLSVRTIFICLFPALAAAELQKVSIGNNPHLGSAHRIELETKVFKDFTITEKAPTKAFSWLKAPTISLTFKNLIRHYTKQAPKHGK